MEACYSLVADDCRLKKKRGFIFFPIQASNSDATACQVACNGNFPGMILLLLDIDAPLFQTA
jgi:hypothetical protein